MASPAGRPSFGGGSKIAMALALVLVPLDGFAQKKAAPSQAPLTYKSVVTQGWKADLPSTWKRKSRRQYGHDGARGLWTYASPNRNLKFRVRLRKRRGGDFKKAVEANLARALARMSHAEVMQKTITDKGGQQLALFLIKGGMRRNKYVRPYFVFRMVSQGDGGPPLRMTLTLSGSGERLDTFMSIYDRIFKSFQLVEPKVTKHLKAIRAARTGSKKNKN